MNLRREEEEGRRVRTRVTTPNARHRFCFFCGFNEDLPFLRFPPLASYHYRCHGPRHIRRNLTKALKRARNRRFPGATGWIWAIVACTSKIVFKNLFRTSASRCRRFAANQICWYANDRASPPLVALHLLTSIYH